MLLARSVNPGLGCKEYLVTYCWLVNVNYYSFFLKKTTDFSLITLLRWRKDWIISCSNSSFYEA